MKVSGTLESLLQLLFPIACVGCKTPATYLCQQCIDQAPRARELPQKFIYALFDYKNRNIRSVIRKLKYGNARRVAESFGGYLYEELLEILSDRLDTSPEERILIMPIPLHKRRKQERGYNQSELLTQALLSYDNNKIFEYAPEILLREHYTESQTRSGTRSDRFAKIKNAFTCKASEQVRGRIIILIDDVTTTGATFSEARKSLLDAKPRAIIALAVAH